MFNSPILEVAIGMVFFYLLLSWLCSAANEIIEGWLRNRANDLEQGIRRLLYDPDPHVGGFWANALRKVLDLFPWAQTPRSQTSGLASRLYSHALISCLYRNSSNLPAYIPAHNFALALMDLLAPGGNSAAGPATIRKVLAEPHAVSSEPLRAGLLALLDTAGDDTAKFRENLENWYNTSMDGVSSWYKQRTQVIILALGCAFAIALNGDSILVINTLWSNSALRTSVAAQAERMANQTDQNGQKNDAPAPASQLAQYAAQFQSLGLPIGWNSQDDFHRPPWAYPTWSERMVWTWRLLLVHGIGWLLTGFAISVGAPFWFDLLNKVIAVRSAVKPKEMQDAAANT